VQSQKKDIEAINMGVSSERWRRRLSAAGRFRQKARAMSRAVEQLDKGVIDHRPRQVAGLSINLGIALRRQGCQLTLERRLEQAPRRTLNTSFL
jgi:hypothetical protein